MIFIILSFIELLGALFNNRKIIILTKPLLIPVLFYENYYKVSTEIMIGLLCATLGDFILLWKHKLVFFLLGILFFMGNHFSYLYYFYTYSLVKFQLCYLFLVCYLEYNIGKHIVSNIENKLLKYMIIIYTAIIGKTIYSILLFHNYIILLGYSLFVLSDIMLGLQINKHYKYTNLYNFGIMATYLLGQYLIITNLSTYIY